jgi:hypothetical protein
MDSSALLSVLEPHLEHVADVTVQLGQPVTLRSGRGGHRRIVPIRGGAISNGITATILRGGADWQSIRDDGTIDIRAEYIASLENQTSLIIRATGVRFVGPESADALAHGNEVDPRSYYFRVTIEFETDSDRYSYLQNSVYVATGMRAAGTVNHRVFRVS